MKFARKICLLLICVSSAFAQTDTAYIQKYPHKYNITVYTGWDFVEVREHEIDYKPNNPVNVGIKFSTAGWMPSIGGSISVTDRANHDLPGTTAFDFQLHHYRKRLMFDLYLQNYTGFYSGDLPDITSYPETDVMRVGAEAAYIVNGNRFSARAAFEQTERQLKSAGSVIIGAGAYYFGLSSSETADLEYVQFGGNFGYAYSFVFTENIFASAAATGGIYYSNRADSWHRENASASFNGMARLSAGYNADNWCVSLLALYNTHIFNRDLSFDAGSFQMAYVRRFHKIPWFLKK